MNLSELNWEHFIIPSLVVAGVITILEISGTGGVWVEPGPGTTVQELKL